MIGDRSNNAHVTVRSATPADEATLLNWRNSPEIARQGLNQRTITGTEHHQWFQKTLEESARELYLIQVDNVAAGMVRYDVESREYAEISIYLVPPYAGHGYGRAAFLATAPSVLMRRGLKRIRARVRKGNPRSLRFFLGLGFEECPATTEANAEVDELKFGPPLIPHSRPSIGEREAAAVAAVIATGHIAEGPRVRELEQRWCQRVGTAGAVAVGSGLGALRLALLASGVGPGSEVVLPAYSCVALLNAVLALGATPVLADVTPDRWTISPEDIRRRLSSRTRAIVAVHLFGAPAPMKELLNLGTPVIEDCAHGIGGFSDSGAFGAAGTLSISSFYATKMLCAGEGGIVAGWDHTLLDPVRQARDYGDQLPDGHFLNDKMTDVEAAMTLVQLDRLDEILARRCEKAQAYQARLAGLAGQNTLVLPANLPTRLWYRYAIRLSAGNAREVTSAMAARGVRAEQPVWDLRGSEYWHGGLPGAELAFDSLLSLPLYPDLSETDQLIVCAALEACL